MSENQNEISNNDSMVTGKMSSFPCTERYMFCRKTFVSMKLPFEINVIKARRHIWEYHDVLLRNFEQFILILLRPMLCNEFAIGKVMS